MSLARTRSSTGTRAAAWALSVPLNPLPSLSLCQHNNCKSGKDCRIININLCNKKFAAHTFHIENKTEMNFRIQSKCEPPPLFLYLPPRAAQLLCVRPTINLAFVLTFPTAAAVAAVPLLVLCPLLLFYATQCWLPRPRQRPRPAMQSATWKRKKTFAFASKYKTMQQASQKKKRKKQKRSN